MISDSLKRKIVNNNEVKQLAISSSNLEDFLSNVKKLELENDIISFFTETNIKDIRLFMYSFGYEFEIHEENIDVSSSWTHNPMILEFLKDEFPERIIKQSVNSLRELLSKNNLITEIEDLIFFYNSSDEKIIDEFNDVNFWIKSGVKENINIKNRNRKEEITRKLIFDKNHPQSFYATTRNIPEMKLEMMRYGIAYQANEFFYSIMMDDDESIEKYFSSKIKRRSNMKNTSHGAVVQTKTNLTFQNINYRLIALGEDWQPAEEWLLFFLYVGRYIHHYDGELNILFSFISNHIPAVIALAGYLDSYFSSISEINSFELENKRIPSFRVGENISYKHGDTWRNGTVVKIFEDKRVPDKFNPYLEIDYKLPAQPNTKACVPYNLWKDKIRVGGVVKKSRGKSSQVKVNDRISEVLINRYGQDSIDYVRMKPSIEVSIAGHNVAKRVKEICKGIQLSDEKGSWMMSDLIYLDDGFDSNYINTHVVKKDEELTTQKKLSIFFGAKTGLDYWNYRTEKNLFFTSRTRQVHLEDAKLLYNNLSNNSLKDDEQRKFESRSLIKYLGSAGIKIPAGVEIYVC